MKYGGSLPWPIAVFFLLLVVGFVFAGVALHPDNRRPYTTQVCPRDIEGATLVSFKIDPASGNEHDCRYVRVGVK